MGEPTCLLHPFPYASGISNEAKQGNPLHALGDSISFGRFMTESLSWEKWSTFSHKRYVEEAERYAQPGSVAQKKAFFEAHYKSIAAKKAAALLEQANAANNPSKTEFEVQDCNASATVSPSAINYSKVPANEQLEVKPVVNENSNKANDVAGIGEMKVADSATESEVLVENPTKNESLNKLESPKMEKIMLEDFKPIVEKKPESSISVSQVDQGVPKVATSPAKPAAPIQSMTENNVTPLTRKPTIDSEDKRRSNLKSLHELIYCSPVKEQDVSTTPATRGSESSRVAPSPHNGSKDCPLTTPIRGAAGAKHLSATPCSENRRSEKPVDTSAPGSKTTGPKWHILSCVCSKPLSACRNKLQSPTLSVPFSSRTKERNARRKQKLEEKFNSTEGEKLQLQTRFKKKAETKLRKLRQSLCFKARPLPDFLEERETTADQIKNEKTPRSLNLGRRNPSSSTLQGIVNSSTQETTSTKNSCPKNIIKKT